MTGRIDDVARSSNQSLEDSKNATPWLEEDEEGGEEEETVESALRVSAESNTEPWPPKLSGSSRTEVLRLVPPADKTLTALSQRGAYHSHEALHDTGSIA